MEDFSILELESRPGNVPVPISGVGCRIAVDWEEGTGSNAEKFPNSFELEVGPSKPPKSPKSSKEKQSQIDKYKVKSGTHRLVAAEPYAVVGSAG